MIFLQHDLFREPQGEDKVNWSLHTNDSNGVNSIFILITTKSPIGLDITLLGGQACV